MTQRRTFIRIVPFLGLLALSARDALGAMVDDKGAQAVALGYVADSTRIDRATHPKFATGQACGNCQLFQGKEKDASGACPLFAGNSVSAKGWCNAYVKKA